MSMAAGFVPVVYTYGLVLKYIYSTCVLVLTNESVTRLLIVTHVVGHIDQ